MLQAEVIDKLTRECCRAIGDFDYYQTIRIYIQMALSIGVEHYSYEMEEIVAMYRDGSEAGRFKSVHETSDKLGISQGNISECLNGNRHSAGGLIFMKTKDYELVEREEKKIKLKF